MKLQEKRKEWEAKRDEAIRMCDKLSERLYDNKLASIADVVE